MTSGNDAGGKPPAVRTRVPLPVGYRAGIISAITVMLGFSMLFVRYWNFEAEGEWAAASVLAALLLALAVILEFITLWRSQQTRDDDEPVYAITLRWFLASFVVLSLSVLIAALAASHAFNL